MLLTTRFDYTFSYWILGWFVLYYYKIVPYNPKSWLVIGILYNVMIAIVMIYYHNSIVYVFLFISINVLIKMVPLYLLEKDRHDLTISHFLQITSYKMKDFAFGLGFFAAYLGWLWFNQKDYITFLLDGMKRIKQHKPVGPAAYYLNRFIGTPSVRFE